MVSSTNPDLSIRLWLRSLAGAECVAALQLLENLRRPSLRFALLFMDLARIGHEASLTVFPWNPNTLRTFNLCAVKDPQLS